ncbi:MAG: hypothetical protein RL483_742 [Pseudomonadota bacterium]
MARRPPLKPGEKRGLPPAVKLTPKWGQTVMRPAAPTSYAMAKTADNPGLASERQRARLVERLAQQGIGDADVLRAMGLVPRHRFVDDGLASRAYEDTALPIGFQQTISQPFVVARSQALARGHLMTPEGMRSALEVGTGCGYQAAVMSELYESVVSVERIPGLHDLAKSNLANWPGGAGLRLVLGDGLVDGEPWGPFDVIVLAAGMSDAPTDLLRQLKVGGVLVAPLGAPDQHLRVIRRLRDNGSSDSGGFETFTFESVAFVPILRGIQP